MSVATAEVLPAYDLEDIIDQYPYLWSDLLAHRNALGLQTEELVPVLQVHYAAYRDRESGYYDLPQGLRHVAPDLMLELFAMEEFVADEVNRLITDAPADGEVRLHAVVDQAEFENTYPEARTLRDKRPYPMSLQHVAVGRVAGELSRRGLDVEVHRGDRRGDLITRRLAVGLLKDETARLLGIDEKKYAKFERSAGPPPAGLVAELQAIDDFIDASARDIEVVDADGISVVVILDERAEFEAAYPQARTLRDGNAYPRRVHRVAAVRRAEMIEAAGGATRIAVLDR